MANMNLIVQWISEQVVLTLGNLKALTAQQELQTLVNNCFQTLNHCRDGVLLGRNKIFRDSCTSRYLTGTHNPEAVEYLMQILSMGWSYEDYLPKQNLRKFFASGKCHEIHNMLQSTAQSILKDEILTSDNQAELLRIQNDFEQLQKFIDGDIDSTLQNLLALQELGRISNSSTCSVSTFTNPFLLACNNENMSDNAIVSFFAWEETERFRHSFIDFPIGNIENSVLLPVFAARILVDNQKMTYRIPPLESNGLVRKNQEQLHSILSTELTAKQQRFSARFTTEKITQNFMRVLKQWQTVFTDTNSSSSSILFQKWTESLQVIRSQDLEDNKVRALSFIKIGLIMAEASSYMMEVSTCLPAVDPVVEKEVLAAYLEEQLSIYNAYIHSKGLHQLMLSGIDLFTQRFDSALIHPYMNFIIENVVSDTEKMNEALAGIVPRPKPPMYTSIMQDMLQFVSSFGSHSKVTEFSRMIQQLLSSVDVTPNNVASVAIQCENWLDCHRNFVRKLSKQFRYWDITAPFLSASVHACAGYQLIYDNIKRHFSSNANTNLARIVEFPQPFHEQRITISGIYEEKWAYQKAKKNVFMSSLISFGNKLKVQQRLSKNDARQLQKYCLEFADWWRTQEDEKVRKKEEEDAFFVFKGRERAMEKTDDEQEDYDIANNFPSFDTDYKDLQEVYALEDGFHTYNPITEQNSLECGELSLEDVESFIEVMNYAASQVANRWLAKSTSTSTISYIGPFMKRFEIGCVAFADGNNVNSMGYREEAEFIVSATVANHQLCKDSDNSKWDPTTYNFYHDSNILEAQKLQSLFMGIKKRVGELLEEWPDHPALQQIIKIMARIESFSIGSPIMKFLTGLELLLATCQEWETVASKRVSIAAQLEELSNLIISWRKMELRFWKNMLDHTLKKQQSIAKTWWFHLFSVIMEVVSKKNDSVKPDETLLPLLHKFMESSTIGEFNVRLQLLESLHRYLVVLESYKILRLEACIHPFIWNTIRYYAMFRESVTIKLAALKAPIEKKLKEFMKISRWNDSNFYALVDSVKKSQRTLNKLIVQFKKAINLPVSSLLVADIETDDRKKLKYKSSKVESTQYTIPENLFMALTTPTKEQLTNFSSSSVGKKRFKKYPKLCAKARNIAAFVINRDGSFCEEEPLELNELTGTIIEQVHLLQNQYIPDSGPQRKRALHNVHNLRRKNLADLFKTLQTLGLSFKKGVIKIQNFPIDTKVPYDFLIEPIDLSVGWGHFCLNIKKSSPDSQLIKAWDSCENYYQKSIGRISAMMKAFQSPSKELGLMIAERCKGFAVELFHVTSEQKIVIERYSSALWNLKVLAEFDCLQNTTLSTEKWKNIFYSNICDLEYQMSQYRMLFESLLNFPSEQQLQLVSDTDVIISRLAALKKDLFSAMGQLVIPIQMHSATNANTFAKIEQLLDEICAKFKDMMSLIPTGSVLSAKIKNGHDLAYETQKDFHSFMRSVKEEQARLEESSNSCTTVRFRSAANKTLEFVLLAFQNLKNFDESPYSTESTNIHDNISSTIVKLMEVPIVAEEFFNMQSIICKRLQKEQDCSTMIEIYSALKPLVKQYILTAQFYMRYFLEHHRECCKLLYVLSGLFGTLAQKGFCLPSDYEEEAAEEGAELDAKSGMGLGEGETTSDAKDVSDRIESEDQLEDTLKAGETVEPADKDLKDDEKGVEMNEDFDGKQQDKQQSSKDKDDENGSDNDDSDQEEELDKQMGDVDGDDEDVLDDKMWGGSSDEEEEEEDNKESNEGKGVSQDEEPQLAPKDSDVNTSEQPKPNEKEKKEQTKEFKEMDDEGEPNDDQTDPYHGENGPDEEPEPMDLPDDLKLDGEEDDDKMGEEQQENNPFDLDTADKEDFQDAETKDDDEVMNEVDGEKEISDKGDENQEDMDVDNPQLEQTLEDDGAIEDKSKSHDEIIDEQDKVEEEDNEGNPEEENPIEQNNKQPETEDNAEPSVDDKQSKSNTSTKELGAPEVQETVMKSVDEEQKTGDNSEKSSGQVNSEDGQGQEGQSVNKENAETTKGEDNKDASRKPGQTDEDRTISSELTKSRLKTVKEKNKPEQGNKDDETCENDDTSDKQAHLYQHIKESEKHDALTVDNATSEQMEQQCNIDETKKNKESEDCPKMDEEDENNDDEDVHDLEDVKLDIDAPDLIKGLPKEKKKRKRQDEPEEVMEEENVETLGVRVPTYGAQRPSESTFHTQIHLLEDKSQVGHLIEPLTQAPQGDKPFQGEITLMTEWHELERKTIPLSQELCEQLRLILEPTQASKLKGDYKTGKRLNMRKVIPYIASGFRKDKIWLRRTQPSKREYQILLALDDSASMCDNQSKQMAFSAVAVVAKALSLLEVGQLAVASFGEDIQLLHPFDEPFTDFSGARLMQKFSFAQRKTRIVQLMETTTALFNHSKQSFGNSTAPVETAQLLLIISDGRAVSHEGNEVVKNAVKKAMDHNVFTVFIIIDNPENQHSILDIQKPIFKEGKSVQFVKYMDDFPFPFYLILRDLAALPSVLSDALRQWFELVTSSSR